MNGVTIIQIEFTEKEIELYDFVMNEACNLSQEVRHSRILAKIFLLRTS